MKKKLAITAAMAITSFIAWYKINPSEMKAAFLIASIIVALSWVCVIFFAYKGAQKAGVLKVWKDSKRMLEKIIFIFSAVLFSFLAIGVVYYFVGLGVVNTLPPSDLISRLDNLGGILFTWIPCGGLVVLGSLWLTAVIKDDYC